MYGLYLLWQEELRRLMVEDIRIEMLKKDRPLQFPTIQMLSTVSSESFEMIKDKLEEASQENWRKLQELTYPHPITENQSDRYQDKEREIYCPNCRYTAVTKLMGPKCSSCMSWMIVVPKQPINLTE